MSEDFGDTLRNILKKLDKLDSIEKSMNDFQATLLKLEGRVQSLESCHATTRLYVDDIKVSLNSIEADCQEASLYLKNVQNDTNTKLKRLEEENFKLGARIKEVEDQHLYLEAYSRRENLKLENIPENVESREDTELVLHSFLERDLGYVDAALVEIQSPSPWKEERREIAAYSSKISEIQGLSKHAYIRPPIARNQL